MQWTTTPTALVRANEVVLGPADQEGAAGPWVELVHLAVNDVPAGSIPAGEGDAADRLSNELRSLPPADRRARFAELVSLARAVAPRSGELGFFVREQLAPGLAELAFGADVTTGTVLGPMTTDSAPELFLVEAQFSGTLDERSIGALIELRAGTTDAFAMARSLSPAKSARALGGPWRGAVEFPSGSGTYRALFDTPIGELADPVVIDGQLVAIRILELRSVLPDAAVIARLQVGGFEHWLDGQRTIAVVTYPGLGASPSVSPGLITPLPQATPRLPVGPPIP